MARFISIPLGVKKVTAVGKAIALIILHLPQCDRRNINLKNNYKKVEAGFKAINKRDNQGEYHGQKKIN